MKRILLIVAGVVLVAWAAVALLRREPVSDPSSKDSELANEGQFLSDSLGVGLLLPSSPGWSFQRPQPVPGGPYMLATHESGDASVRFFVHNKPRVNDISGVIQRRRDQLAASFRVTDIDKVIEQVLLEGQREFDGYPAWQWQALTEPVAMAGEDPAKVMFLVQIFERQRHIFETVGLVRVPLGVTAEQHAANVALQGDVTFILQSAQAR